MYCLKVYTSAAASDNESEDMSVDTSADISDGASRSFRGHYLVIRLIRDVVNNLEFVFLYLSVNSRGRTMFGLCGTVQNIMIFSSSKNLL